MSIKSKGRKLGRLIRRLTGIKFPIAMKIGKMIAQDKSGQEMVKSFPQHLEFVSAQHGDCLCCSGLYDIRVKGPKGSVIGEGSYLTEGSLEKEKFSRKSK